jgi:hypothetical protein
MKKTVSAFIAFCALSCFAGGFKVTNANGIEGAIVPAEEFRDWKEIHQTNYHLPVFGMANEIGERVESFWTPSMNDIFNAESMLSATLKKAQTDPEPIAEYYKKEDSRERLKFDIGQILENYQKYYRQYVGLTINGKKYIYLNSIPRESKMSSEYKKRVIYVLDGGFWFWKVLYSVEDKKFQRIEINGRA